MPSERPDGGAAFPGGGVNGGYPGMTMREYYAGQLLLGFAFFQAPLDGGTMSKEAAAKVAENCFMVADAMLAAREGR